MERPSLPPGEMESVHEKANEFNADKFADIIERTEAEAEVEDLKTAIEVAEKVKEHGGFALAVGGFVRDEALRRMGHDISGKDVDLEVYGVPFDELQTILGDGGELNVVGASYNVVKYRGLDITIPRRDSKVAPGHRGFIVEGDPEMDFKEASKRRDFTINAMGLDPLTGQIHDEHGGLEDLKVGVLRATDRKLFGDDSLRVLRAMQLAGRFNMTVDPETADICRGLDLSDLPQSRIGEEWRKLLEKSPRPSVGMEVARELGVVEKLHPELKALIGCEQDPEWHPEGDVWIHTKMVVDEAVQVVDRENLDELEARVIILAALTHDLGKPATTEINPKTGRITTKGHEAAGIKPARKFMESIEVRHDVINRVLPLVNEHMFPPQNPDASAKAIRRLAIRLEPASIQELVWVVEADQRGRGVEWKGFPKPDLAEKASELNVVEKPEEPIIMGRHLLKEGVEPSPQMGQLLRTLHEAQLDGVFRTFEEGLEYYRTRLSRET